ncbi:hypothetical protein F5Y10DRAFT_147305 [Nemania abortiva]|nr:hypothetical protein F5Y10DRAFT_147305 [Nemania abortiva]
MQFKTLIATLAASSRLALVTAVPLHLSEYLDAVIETHHGHKAYPHGGGLGKIDIFVEENYGARHGNHWEAGERHKMQDIDTLIETNYGKRDASIDPVLVASYGLKQE